MMFLFLSSLAFADESVITLRKGERAPWDGTLLSPEATAKVLITPDSELQKCLIDSKKDLALQEARFTLEKNNATAKLAACTLRYEESKVLYENQISFLEKQAVTQKWEPPVYYTLGILTGAGIVYGSSLILKNLGQ
tara:strand:- start:158 stop:568 length:411 start_codon:yes stop_codon:yes gene_type:complete